MNRILRSGQSRLILEAQLKSVVLRRMIANKDCKFIWSKALAVFHPACEAYRIQMRMLRIPRKLAIARMRRVVSIDIETVPYQPLIIKECPKCKVIFFGDFNYCDKHR